MSDLILRNRQHTRPVNLPVLRRIARVLLEELLGLEQYDLGVRLVGRVEMIRVNRRFLNHPGSTDVITFDHLVPSARNPRPATRIEGEMFICLDDAVAQARKFRTAWQSELVRYLAHGALHLRGYDDLEPAARRAMKREENRLLRSLAKRFRFDQLARPRRARAGDAAAFSRASAGSCS